MELMLTIFNYLKSLICNKSFLLGAILATCMFSHYIFGNDNLLEQLGELFISESTGRDIDFTPENINSSNDSLKAIVETIKK